MLLVLSLISFVIQIATIVEVNDLYEKIWKRYDPRGKEQLASTKKQREIKNNIRNVLHKTEVEPP